MRWWLLGAVLVVGCDSTVDPVDTTPEDTTDTDPVEIPVQWVDRTVETSTTLSGVYSGGRGATVVGDDGKAWALAEGRPVALATGVSANLTGVWGRGDQSTLELVAVGYAGTVLNWTDADGFVASTDGALGTTNFEDVDGKPGDLTAVSATGVYRFDGDKWAFEDTVFNRTLRRVYVDAAGAAWAVGDSGTIVRRVADKWEQVAAPSGVDLRDVHGTGQDVWIVGNRGTVLHWNGTTLEKIPTDSTVNYQGVWAAPSGNVYIVGNNGTAIMWDPTVEPPEEDTASGPGAFIPLPTGSDANLYAVYGSDEVNIWAVGNRGAVFRYTGPR
jgi:hypothetical protein